VFGFARSMDETPPKDVTIHDGDVWISEVLRMTKRVRSFKEIVHSTSMDFCLP
jgi:hypothetical protein